jgi:hypothetical protein
VSIGLLLERRSNEANNGLVEGIRNYTWNERIWDTLYASLRPENGSARMVGGYLGAIGYGSIRIPYRSRIGQGFGRIYHELDSREKMGYLKELRNAGIINRMPFFWERERLFNNPNLMYLRSVGFDMPGGNVGDQRKMLSQILQGWNSTYGLAEEGTRQSVQPDNTQQPTTQGEREGILSRVGGMSKIFGGWLVNEIY